MAEKTGLHSAIRETVNPHDGRSLDVIGKLRQLSVQEDDSPPQLVIVGDQSSGKTSLLEALTGFSFSTPSQFCTRFATRIILRHVSEVEKSYVKVSIVRGPFAREDKEAEAHLARFQNSFDRRSVPDNGFAEILDAAAKYLGLPHSASKETKVFDRQFSDKVLQIEISGPDLHDLRIVDLPGLVHNPTKNQTQDDIEMISRIVFSCISDPHTVILAVMDATYTFANQRIFRMAKSVDPQGLRTIGVITKCDVLQYGDQDRNLTIARNETGYLTHGLFLVKNRSRMQVEAGVTIQQRNTQEQMFFAAAPWNNFKDRQGIESLRRTLGDVFFSLVQKDFIRLVQDIRGLAIETRELPSTNEKAEGPFHPEGPNDTDLESGVPKRPTVLLSSVIVAVTIAIVLTLMGLGAQEIALEIKVTGSWSRMALLCVVPLQIFISMFFCQALVGNLCQLIGPVGHLKKNSKFYSAVPPPRLNRKNGPLPHVTVQCPVYKEGLSAVIEPTVRSVEAAIATYRRQGGTANIFVNDDAMQLLPPHEAQERRDFYNAHSIGWVARPEHNPNPEGEDYKFIRKGKFKKASNMNYGLMISMKVEELLLKVERDGLWSQEDEDGAYQHCLDEVLLEEQHRAWAGGNIRVGDYILLIDCDTRVPCDCMLDAVSELEETPKIGIIQYSSGVMQVTNTFFENGITFFTNLIYTAIRYAVAAGDVSPFVGHNAFLRWSALQETSFYDGDDGPGGHEKFWSESHVSEDFDMALRLQTSGYIVRLGAYTGDGFKEGVSLTVYDELARWEKYAYGCNELIFHPIKYWLVRGPFTPLFRKFIFSNMPIGSKCTILAYIGTYYAIGYAWISTLLNYFLVGWLNGNLDHYYVNSFEVYLAIIMVFTVLGNVSLATMRYRAEGKVLYRSLLENFSWVPMFSIFLGGISLHISQALLSHLFSIEMTWGSTSKELVNTTFFVELPLILRRFKYTFVFCVLCIVLMTCGATVFPPFWRIDFFTAIWPLSTVVTGHFLLPVLLNPALMLFNW